MKPLPSLSCRRLVWKTYDIDKDYEMTKDALHRASIFREVWSVWQSNANKQQYMKAYPDDEMLVINLTSGKEGDLVLPKSVL